ncbi:MAG: hypothetical protein DI535_07100 [Citrobacter freundii]|nr:MAG: hypothetical protein DI535_07100 [Citrobacter freundii]
MKRNIALLFLLLCLTVIFYSCQKPGCTGNAGPSATQLRPLSSFSKVELRDNINLVLIQGNEEKIEITGPQNVIANVTTEVINNSLTIANKTECRWLRDPDEKITARLYLKTLESFEYNGSGDVTNEDTLRGSLMGFNSDEGAGIIDLKVNVDEIAVRIFKENASMIFHGYARHCGTYTNARGILDLSELQTKSMYIIYSGLADTHVNVSEGIEAYVRYRGNVYCKGNPVIIRQEYFSSGRLIFTP